MAPTMSFWDCGEFISCAAKLEVGHAPGAPLFLLLARFFSLFAGSVTQIAWWTNLSSVLFSALTIMVLFATIKDLLLDWRPKSVKTNRDYILVVLASLVGSLAFAFTDTIWFSAVESEVYALSLFFTAVTFWMILQWKKAQIKGEGGRWIVLISYVMGLSIGVHLLNLLTIPVLAMVVVHQKQKSPLGLLKGFIIGLVVLAIVLFLLVQNGLVPAEHLEVFLVNKWNWPQHSGLIAWLIIVLGGLSLLAWRTWKKKQVIHFISINLLVLILGFGTYAMIIIRSQADTPINLNEPNNVILLNDYLNRKQYGDKPLLKGPSFAAQAIDVKESKSYRYSDREYVPFSQADHYVYNDADLMLFPRMFSNQPHHIYGYKQWAGLQGDSNVKPSFIDNLRFFFNYQVNFMYVRYFMWNFSGRQNDIQGEGSTYHGNWISGIPFIDSVRAGNRKYLSGDEIHNEGHNRYFMIPFLLGLIGIIGLLLDKRGGKSILAIVGTLFLLTGFFIILYLNQTPYEPRERDYAYVGSFYAYAIFLGFGCYIFLKSISRYGKLTLALASVVLLLGGPVLVLSQNYNDHDRSGNYLSIDSARSYLESCDQNAILFTYGDNDTYPLWYAQEVEGIRTDVRVLNIGLLSAIWYINQATMKMNQSEPLDMTIPLSRYEHDDFGYMPVIDRTDGVLYPAETVLSIIKRDNDRAKVRLRNGQSVTFFPAGSIKIDSMRWDIPSRSLHRGQLAFIDIIVSNINKRPIYFTSGTANDALLGLDKYLYPLGMVEQLINHSNIGELNIDKQLDVFMNRVKLRHDSSVWYNETDRKSFLICRYRQAANDLIDSLMKEGRTDDAIQVAGKSIREYPVEMNPDDVANIEMIDLMYSLGLNNEASAGLKELTGYYITNLNHFKHLSFDLKQSYYSVIKQETNIVQVLGDLCAKYDEGDLLNLIEQNANQ